MEKSTARHQFGIPANVPVVLFFGFIRAYKGLDLLLEALADSPGVHALIAGECYDDWQSYQHIIQRNKLADRVHVYTDFIPAQEDRVFRRRRPGGAALPHGHAERYFANRL